MSVLGEVGSAMTSQKDIPPPAEETMSNAEWLADVEEAVTTNTPDPLHEDHDKDGNGDERH